MFSVIASEEDDGLLNELLAFLEANNAAGDQNGAVSSSGPSADSGPAEGATPSIPPATLPANHTRRLSDSKTPANSSKNKRVRDADKVKELEALAAAKMDQFAALVQRNTELKYKNKILSDVVMLRELQIQLTKSSAHDPAQLLRTAAAAVPGGGMLGSNPMLFSMNITQAVRAPGSVQLLLAPELVPSLDRDTLRAMTRSQLVARWKAFVSEASLLLLALDDNPGNEEAAMRMRDATAGVAAIMRSMAMWAPDMMLQFVQTHLETDTLVAPDSGHWLLVLQTLQLTEEQLRDLRAVHDLFNRIMQGVLAERRALQEQLARGMDVNRGSAATLHSTFVLSPEVEVLPALERNMRKEASAHSLLRGFLFGRTLSILQFCRVGVHSYPFFPNATGLVAAAAGVGS